MSRTKLEKYFPFNLTFLDVRSVTNKMFFFGIVGVFSVFLVSGCERVQNIIGTQASSNVGKNEKPIVVTSVIDVQSAEIKPEANKLIEAGNFAQIEKEADEYRSSQVMFLDGYWKLGHFYLGLARLPNSASDTDWEKRCQLIRSWVTSNPKSITARVALARVYYEGAYRARGYGYANNVSQTQWATMNQRLDEAVGVLSNSVSMKNQCPGWYAVAQRVAFLRQLPQSELDAITNEAIRQFPHYYDFYFEKMIYLMPRWFGNRGDWQKYAEEVADQMGGNDGDIFYARAVWNMELMVDTENSVELATFDWPRAKRGFDLLVKEPNSFGAASAFAQAAWLKRDKDQLKSLFDNPIGNHYDNNAWLTEDEFRKARNWAYNG